MPYIEFQGKKIEVDDEGYIQHKEDWSRELAEWMAKQDGIELDEGKWKLIDWIREYFEEYGVAPPIRTLAKKVAEVYNLPNVREGNKYIYKLFPEGPARQLVRYAGLSKPTGCV